MDGVGNFHYTFCNGMSTNAYEDRMQELHPWELDVTTYHFRVQKIVGI